LPAAEAASWSVSAEVTFARLRTGSQHTTRTLRDVADHLVATGELPGD
jgi:hypothetical protein